MKVIAKKRGEGKTTELIKLSAETGDYIVCKDHRLAYYTARMAKDLGLIIPFPLTFEEFLNKQFNGREIKGFLVDDIDLLFIEMFFDGRPPIHAVTISTGENYACQ